MTIAPRLTQPPTRLPLVSRLALLLWLLSLSTWAQHYPTRTYTLRDGLPQMQVMSALADSRGYLWVGTKGGLAKFDGEKFETFNRHDYHLPAVVIHSLAEDRHHRLWLSTALGLIRFDGGRFDTFPFGESLGKNTTAIQADDRDRIWLINNSTRELWYLERGQYRPARQVIAGLDSLRVADIQWDKTRNRLWITASPTRDQAAFGLYYLAGNRCLRLPNYQAPAGLQSQLEEAAGSVLLRETDQRGHANVLRISPDDRVSPFLQFTEGQGRVLAPAPFDFYDLIDGHVLKVAAGNRTLETVVVCPGNMAHGAPVRLGGKVFYSTEKGLLEVLDNGLRFFDETEAPYVWSVAERPNGDIWGLNWGSPPRRLSSPESGAEASTPLEEPGLTQLLEQERPTKKGDWYRYYYHSATDRRGTLYLPHALGLIAHEGQSWRFLTRPEDGSVMAAYADERTTDRVIAGIEGGFRVYEGGKLRRVLTKKEGMHDCFFGLCALADTEPDTYWLGSATGLSRYNYRTGRFEHFSEANGKLPSLGVVDLCHDARGTVWMATRDGLGRYDRKAGRVVREAPELLKSRTQFVGLFNDSTLAVGDYYGVYLLNLGEYYRSGRVVMQLLNHRTGFVGIEPGQAGFFKDRRGRVWITSSTLLTMIDTRQFRHQPQSLRPVIRSLNGQRLPFACADSVFVLPGQQATARVGFEALGDNRPAQTQWAWHLDDDPWSDWQTEPYAVLRDYDGGNHCFHLRARSGGLNETTERVATLHFRAQIPWYHAPSLRRNLPYLLLVTLILGVAGLGLAADRQRRMRRAEQRLEQRTKEALFLNVQTLQSQLNTHFLFNVLVPLQNLILQNKSDEAARLLVEFSNLVREFLNASSLGNGTGGSGSLLEREITLAEELSLLRRYVGFEQLLYRDKLTVHFDDDRLNAHIDPETITLPPMLIQPYVENAIKHGLVHKPGPGNLWIRFVVADETLVCTIEDDGIGREGMRQIHEHSPRAYKSLGSDLVQRRVDSLNQLGYDIRIRTDDRATGGTVVTLTIARTDA